MENLKTVYKKDLDIYYIKMEIYTKDNGNKIRCINSDISIINQKDKFIQENINMERKKEKEYFKWLMIQHNMLVISKLVINQDMENIDLQIQMKYTRVNGSMINIMEKESLFGQMVKNTLEGLKMMLMKDMENTLFQKRMNVRNMKDIGKMEIIVDRELFIGKTVKNIQGSGKIIIWRVKEVIIIHLEIIMKENLKRVKEMGKELMFGMIQGNMKEIG